MNSGRNVTQLALTALLFFSCSREISQLDKLQPSNHLADATDEPTTCYATYLNTIKDPPPGYVPLTAENDLANCQGAWTLGNPTKPTPKLYPPPPETTPVRVPFTDYSDQQRYQAFFGVNSSSSNAEFQAASDTFLHFTMIICDAISTHIDPVVSPSPTPEQKRAASVIYTVTNPQAFVSAAERNRFLEFLTFIFDVNRNEFVFIGGSRAPQTGIDLFALSPYFECINFRLGLPNTSR
jgi:hypothetical protein